MNRSLLVRAGAVAATATAIVLAVAGPASAHVTVNPKTATQGGYTKVTFRVPDESDTASTTKLEVTIPTDNPIASVSLKPMAGWTATTEKTKLTTPITDDDGGQITEAISKITWTADAASGIKPGYFQEFDVSLGPLPKTDKVIFKALQTYSDGKIVRWIDEPTTDGSEPEHPAPVLTLTAADQSTASAPAAAAAASTTSEDSGSSTGTWLGLAGLLVGLAGLVAGLLAYRRTATPTS